MAKGKIVNASILKPLGGGLLDVLTRGTGGDSVALKRDRENICVCISCILSGVSILHTIDGL